jgi:dienelactone hydrolase
MLVVMGLLNASEFVALREPPAQRPPPLPAILGEGDDVTAWEAKRAELRAAWETIIGPMPPRDAPLDVEVLSTEELNDHTRLLLRYRNEPHEMNDAYLLIPKGFDGPRPGMVCLHSTSKTSLRDPVGLANRENVHVALHLVRRGYVCIAPRNYLFAVEGRSYQRAADEVLERGPYKTGMAKMLFDAMRAVDVLLERPEVDATRIGAIGHSLGAKQALYLPAFDERIIAAISCEGGVGLAMSNWEAPSFDRDNHEVMALIAPRALLIIGGESADGAHSWPYIEATLPVWRLYDAEARLGLLRHDEKHEFPSPGAEREAAYEWLDAMLAN